MSAIFSRFRVSVTNFNSHGETISSSNFRHFFLHNLKWCHGLPGIPNDDTVVRLKNTSNGSELYLVGTCHASQESAETVRKVINLVKPDAVAVELCRKRAIKLKNREYEDVSVFRVFLESTRVPGGLHRKISALFFNFLESMFRRWLRAKGIIPGNEFKVALEECERLNAKWFVIDQDIRVVFRELHRIFSTDISKVPSQDQFWKMVKLCNSICHGEYTRANARACNDVMMEISPELVKVVFTERDILMCSKLRMMRGKIVAVVGMGHMDGIELYWKICEREHLHQQSEAANRRG